jgi:hypothetical protein
MVELELHPACNNTIPSTTAKKIPSKARFLRDTPAPSNPTPRIGSHVAYVRPRRSKLPVVVTLAVVEIASVRLCGPLLMLEIVDPVGSGKEQTAPAGSPAPHEIAADSGKPAPVGVTKTEKLTLSPDAIVLLLLTRLALTEKSLNEAVLSMLCPMFPGELRTALLLNELDC